MAVADTDQIVFEDVSKFYGEILGVNHVSVAIPPGITSLVGPNGSGKTTLMNLMTGLLRPTQGSIRVLGVPPDEPERLFRMVGYCTQYDSFPRGLTGYEFLYHFACLRGHGRAEAERIALAALERVDLLAAAGRRVAGYSKGMRQRIKLAQAICHDPAVLVLDEPLNGLDPMARAEMIDLFQQLGAAGRHVIVSSHILHEVDAVSDRVVFLDQGYVMAEGSIQGVRGEVTAQPMQVLVRCDRPELLAARAFAQDGVIEVRLHDDRQGLYVRTRDPGEFYLLLNRVVLADGLVVESVRPADDDVQAVYRYLIGDEREAM
jgi:ABC-2 type transport system ATP-binding protein